MATPATDTRTSTELIELLQETFGEQAPIDAEEEYARRLLQKSTLFDLMIGLAEAKWPGFEDALSRVLKRIAELEKVEGLA